MTVNFQCEWIGKRKLPDLLSQEERYTRCEFSLLVNGHHYFRNEDLLNKHRVNKSSHVATYPLAVWFVSNWWRLLCEAPKTESIKREQIDWLMSHKLGAAASGYYWPDLTVFSDGESVHFYLEAGQETKAPLRYLDTKNERVSIAEYENAVTSFVDHVITRLDHKKVTNSDLKAAWEELTLERSSKELTLKRRLEATLGFDPEEAPEGLIADLALAAAEHGRSSIEELIQAFGSETTDYLVSLDDTLKAEFQLQCAGLGWISTTSGTPWQRGYALAASLRKLWSLPKGRIDNITLADTIAVPVNKIECVESAPSSIIAIGKRRDSGTVAFSLGKARIESRRFMLARLIGDAIATGSAEHLLPCTEARTSRQKFQRAFAQEFLCPYQDVIEFLDTDSPSDEQQEIAAEHFQVSPVMISRIFQNHGQSIGPSAYS